MTQQLLDGPDVVAVLEEMGGERVAECVTGRGLWNGGPSYGLVDCPLEHGLVKMVPAPLSGDSIDMNASCREDPLPSPLPAGVGILARKRPRQLHFSASNDDLVGRKVNVFDAESGAFQETEPRAVQQNGHQTWRALKRVDDGADFFSRIIAAVG
jgi:hypothetical protein